MFQILFKNCRWFCSFHIVFFFFAFTLIICIQHDGGCHVDSRWVVCVSCKRTFFAISSNNITTITSFYWRDNVALSSYTRKLRDRYSVRVAGFWLSLIDPQIRADRFVVRFCLLVVPCSLLNPCSFLVWFVFFCFQALALTVASQ